MAAFSSSMWSSQSVNTSTGSVKTEWGERAKGGCQARRPGAMLILTCDPGTVGSITHSTGNSCLLSCFVAASVQRCGVPNRLRKGECGNWTHILTSHELGCPHRGHLKVFGTVSFVFVLTTFALPRLPMLKFLLSRPYDVHTRAVGSHAGAAQFKHTKISPQDGRVQCKE